MSQTLQMSPAGSIERDDEKPEKKAKSRRPPNTAFRQQRLKAWQPILTPKTVLPLFYTVGLLFGLFGGLMLWASSEVQELSIDYTQCGTLAPIGQSNSVAVNASRVISHFSVSNDSQANNKATTGVRWSREADVPVSYGVSGNYTVPTQSCTLQFYIPNDIKPPVYLYYRLSNFYQNHRRYVKSIDQDQLSGQAQSNSTIASSNCNPLTNNASGFAYYPCGLIANSVFNDTIFPPVLITVAGQDIANQTYNMTSEGIGWSSDASIYKKTSYNNSDVSPPPNWIKRYPSGYNDEFPIPDISTMESFWVWMRTSGLPTFSKLALQNKKETMAQGVYTVQIYDDFPSEAYDGTKELLISTRTVLGGKNPFLGIAYIVVAGICIILGTVFTAMQLIRPRKLGDHTYLSWNNNEPSTAVATGRNVNSSA